MIHARNIFWRSAWLTVVVWAVISWPLARHFFEGIPSSATSVSTPQTRAMTQGDHLQLLYNYWVYSDMLRGETPWMLNIYEFNTGNDAELSSPGNVLDQPFTTFFALFSICANRAAAWNLTGLISLWLTLCFTWLWIRRYTAHDGIAGLASLIAIILPYRWSNLLGGSPMGFAMIWTPLLLWGLDQALRDGRLRGGIVAAIAILFARWNDTHVFFFSVLTIPGWCLLVLIDTEFRLLKKVWFWKPRLIAILPLIVGAGGLVVLGHLKKSTDLANTTIGAGRSLHEVSLFSPHWNGFFQWHNMTLSASIFIGFTLAFILLAGMGLTLWRLAKPPLMPPSRQRCFFFLLLLAGVAFIALLALGTNGPSKAALFMRIRDLIPPYMMIRQPAKIFCLVPSFAALLVALSLLPLWKSSRRLGPLLCGIAVLAVLVECSMQIRPEICLIDYKQGAYQRVADDARKNGKTPHVLVLTLWPGESSWASLYEHYVSLYRIRMLNGYTPIVPRKYIENVFDAFQSVNVGLLTDQQIEALRRYKVDYILLHEDAYPEKASYFPVSLSLKRLLNHPRLHFMGQDQQVWAFKITDPVSAPRKDPVPGWKTFFPTLVIDFENMTEAKPFVMADKTASGDYFVRLPIATPPLKLQPFEHIEAPEPSLKLRVRGHGCGTVYFTMDGQTNSAIPFVVQSDNWQWITVPFEIKAGSHYAGPEFSVTNGAIDLDMLLYCSGPWTEPGVGQTVSIPAPLFFHGGYSDLATGEVVLRSRYEHNHAIFYGPRMPLPGQRYLAEFTVTTEAPPGTHLGSLSARRWPVTAPVVQIYAGQKALMEFQPHGFPVELVLDFTRKADIRIGPVRFTRLE